jgi:hypothetical protein
MALNGPLSLTESGTAVTEKLIAYNARMISARLEMMAILTEIVTPRQSEQ